MDRSTVRLDEGLMPALKDRAHREATSVAKLINQAVREFLDGRPKAATKVKPYKQKTYDMGARFDGRLPSHIDADLQDEEIMEKMRRDIENYRR